MTSTSPFYKPLSWIKLDRGDIIEYVQEDNSSAESSHHTLTLKQGPSFNDLPLEVVEHVIEYLQIHDVLVGRIMFLNRTCYALFSGIGVDQPNSIMPYMEGIVFSKLLYSHYRNYVTKHVKSIEKQIDFNLNVENFLCKCIYVLDLPFHWSHWYMIYQRFQKLVRITDTIKLYSPERVTRLQAGCVSVISHFTMLASRVKQLIQLDSQYKSMKHQNSLNTVLLPNSSSENHTHNFLNYFPMDVCIFWMMHDGESSCSDETCYLIGVSRLLTISEIFYHFRAENAKHMLLSEISGIFSTHLNIFNGQVQSYQGWNVNSHTNWLEHLHNINHIDVEKNQYIRVLPYSCCEEDLYYKF
ncbi:hypothetical protein C9374_004904 [Naegleria lovaniensis]|uniref:F-box domain-containing protein n=1 Tax=Naegleria lovaniensis TaxID=51637 RepID=A0AA88KJ60_NAELO|nr:uncharacterized protein C9374_004904 [Naegleria lovaniensis]KAG2382937.1 hypothetical protein C9374_004904 [Naegleria lovaniensis]